MLGALLAKHKVIDRAALEDPEGYDQRATLEAVYATASDLIDFLEDDGKDEPERGFVRTFCTHPNCRGKRTAGMGFPVTVARGSEDSALCNECLGR